MPAEPVTPKPKGFKDRGKPMGCTGLLILPFGFLFFSASVAFLVHAVYNYQRQAQTTGYLATTATITHAEVDVSRSSDSTNYYLDIRYTYDVAGTTYESTRYAFGTGPATRQDKYDFVRDHPAGATITTYHDPDDPATAVLVTGVTDAHVRVFYFLVFFNAIGVGMLVTAANALRIMITAPPFGGAIVRTASPERLRIRLPGTPPHIVGSVVAVTVSGIGAAALVISSTPRSTSPTPVVALAGVALIAGVAAWAWRRMGPTGVHRELVVDTQRNTLQLPISFGRDNAVTLDIRTVHAVSLRERTIRKKTSNGTKTKTVFAVELVTRTNDGTDEQRHTIAEWHDELRAAGLASDIATFAGAAFDDRT